jgi:hypothetical protein
MDPAPEAVVTGITDDISCAEKAGVVPPFDPVGGVPEFVDYGIDPGPESVAAHSNLFVVWSFSWLLMYWVKSQINTLSKQSSQRMRRPLRPTLVAWVLGTQRSQMRHFISAGSCLTTICCLGGSCFVTDADQIIQMRARMRRARVKYCILFNFFMGFS